MIQHNCLTLPTILISEIGRLGDKTNLKINKTRHSQPPQVPPQFFLFSFPSCTGGTRAWGRARWAGAGALRTEGQAPARVPWGGSVLWLRHRSRGELWKRCYKNCWQEAWCPQPTFKIQLTEGEDGLSITRISIFTQKSTWELTPLVTAQVGRLQKHQHLHQDPRRDSHASNKRWKPLGF